MSYKTGVLNRYKGFTLIELLVSMAVLGIMLAVISQAFSLGQSSRERGEKVLRQSLHLRTGVDLISKQLRSTFPLVTRNREASKDVLHFSGDAQSLRFFSTLPFGMRRRGGLFQVRYFLEKGDGEGGRVLMVDQHPAYEKKNFDGIGEEGRGVVLLPELIGANWAYSDGKEWRERWDEEAQKRLPEKVRLRLHYMRGKKVQVHEMIVPIQARLEDDLYEGSERGREDL